MFIVLKQCSKLQASQWARKKTSKFISLWTSDVGVISIIFVVYYNVGWVSAFVDKTCQFWFWYVRIEPRKIRTRTGD